MQPTFDASDFLAACSGRPGVYRMFDEGGKLLYVGKAKNLKKRLASYFRKTGLAPKTAALVARIAQVETTITANETEALLLEQTLIKEWRPPYNILLRDDKSYPYVHLSDGEFPRLSIHRGAKKQKGRYFGPYPSAGAIRESLNLLQKAFLVRQCEDSYFRNRTRPCLQYQIKRCKGPCVGLVEANEYAEDVRHSVMFLEGRSNALAAELTSSMEQAAMNLEFERAAELRDQVSMLRRVQDQQSIEGALATSMWSPPSSTRAAPVCTSSASGVGACWAARISSPRWRSRKKWGMCWWPSLRSTTWAAMSAICRRS